MPPANVTSGMTPEQWLAKGGEIPGELADDDNWCSAVANLVKSNPALALGPVSQPALYQSGLGMLGIRLEDLRRGVVNKLEEGVRSIEEKFGDRSLPAIFSRLIRRTLDLTAERVRQTYPFIKPEHVTLWLQQLLAANHDAFGKLLTPQAAGPTLVQVLTLGSHGQRATPAADRDLQYALLGSAAQAIVQPKSVSLKGRLLLAALAMTPLQDGKYVKTDLLTQLGADPANLDSTLRGMKGGGFGILTTTEVPEGTDAVLAKSPEVADVLVKMNLPIDLKAALVEQILSGILREVNDPWPRMTGEALTSQDGVAAEARQILERVGSQYQIDANLDRPETIKNPTLWQRRPHAAGWITTRVASTRSRAGPGPRRNLRMGLQRVGDGHSAWGAGGSLHQGWPG